MTIVRRPRAFFAALLAPAVLLLPGPALAGPPFRTDDPEPTDTGHWEIYAPLAEASGRGSDHEGSLGAELNYGAAANLQLTIGLPVSYVHDASRYRWDQGDLELSAGSCRRPCSSASKPTARAPTRSAPAPRPASASAPSFG
jgi:hypothetical protein